MKSLKLIKVVGQNWFNPRTDQSFQAVWIDNMF